jgi:hypothetical protein
MEVIMNIMIVFLVALSLSVISLNICAATQDDAYSAQMQKDKVPDSTTNGNYLEPQPDENGAIQQNTKDIDRSKKHKTNKKHAGSKSTNRGQQTAETPEESGLTPEQK